MFNRKHSRQTQVILWGYSKIVQQKKCICMQINFLKHHKFRNKALQLYTKSQNITHHVSAKNRNSKNLIDLMEKFIWSNFFDQESDQSIALYAYFDQFEAKILERQKQISRDRYAKQEQLLNALTLRIYKIASFQCSKNSQIKCVNSRTLNVHPPNKQKNNKSLQAKSTFAGRLVPTALTRSVHKVKLAYS